LAVVITRPGGAGSAHDETVRGGYRNFSMGSNIKTNFCDNSCGKNVISGKNFTNGGSYKVGQGRIPNVTQS